jgi:uncharacterized protein YjeT (DUF2065 family)
VADPRGAPAERDELGKTFAAWRTLAEAVTALADTLPIARDGVAAAQALSQLGDLGLQTLAYLGTGGAPAGWKSQAAARLEELARPQGLLRLAGVDAVRTLIQGL